MKNFFSLIAAWLNVSVVRAFAFLSAAKGLKVSLQLDTKNQLEATAKSVRKLQTKPRCIPRECKGGDGFVGGLFYGQGLVGESGSFPAALRGKGLLTPWQETNIEARARILTELYPIPAKARASPSIILCADRMASLLWFTHEDESFFWFSFCLICAFVFVASALSDGTKNCFCGSVFKLWINFFQPQEAEILESRDKYKRPFVCPKQSIFL